MDPVKLVVAVAAAVLLSCSAAAAAPKTFQDCPNCPKMVVVPGGTFTMGSPEGEALRDPDETPHKVTIKKFAVSMYPVTWNEWEACVRDNHCDGQAVELALRTDLQGKYMDKYVDHGRGTRPVVGISWWDAQKFAGWLNKQSGGKDVYRLLSESEFEYAQRGGTASAYPWGDKPDHDFANFGKADKLGGEAGGRDIWVDVTSPVGSFPANAFGLHDMSGNVYQWVEDCYEKDATKLPVDGSAVRDGNCFMRVMRSTSFTSQPHTLRSANRAGQYPPFLRGRNYLGIRIAKTLP